MKRSRHRCKTATVALIWALLTTPATTLPLLYWSESNRSLKQLADSLPFAGTAALVGAILIGLPILAIVLSMLAQRRINSSWTPVGGGDFAQYALGIGILSTVSATLIFVIDLL
ncbi:MAG: hypothetical protein V4710_10755 [Verrucomicrobiota bacterium]